MDIITYIKNYTRILTGATYIVSDMLSAKRFNIYLKNIHVTTHRRWGLGYASKCARNIHKTEENIHTKLGLSSLKTTTT